MLAVISLLIEIPVRSRSFQWRSMRAQSMTSSNRESMCLSRTLASGREKFRSCQLRMRGRRSNPRSAAWPNTGSEAPWVSAWMVSGWMSETLDSSESSKYTASHTPHGMK